MTAEPSPTMLPGDELPGDELPGDELPGDELPGGSGPATAVGAGGPDRPGTAERRRRRRRRRRRSAVDRGAAAVGGLPLTGVGTVATRVVTQAASILEEELAAGIVAAQAVEGRFVDVERIRSADSEAVLQRLRRDAHDVVDIIIDLVDVAVSSTGSLGRRAVSLGAPAEGNGAPVSEARGPRVPALVVADPVPAGTDARTTLAVENNSEHSTSEFSFACSDLVSARGRRIPADAVSFSPQTVSVGADDTAKVTVTVAVPAGTPAGFYSGLVQAGGLEQVRAVLTLQVS
jgi:hypothetical protein